MLTEAKPVILVFCILSLYGLFYSVFLDPLSDSQQRICDSLALLLLTAAISFLGGFIFREAEAEQGPRTSRMRLTATLPVQLFFWASGIMVVVFLVSWYLQTHCIFYRDTRLYGL